MAKKEKATITPKTSSGKSSGGGGSRSQAK